VGLGDWWKKILRERDQETVELAETGIAPESEVRQTEEWVAEKHHSEEPPDAAAD
jgi:hypothetical protein